MPENIRRPAQLHHAAQHDLRPAVMRRSRLGAAAATISELSVPNVIHLNTFTGRNRPAGMCQKALGRVVSSLSKGSPLHCSRKQKWQTCINQK